MNESKNNLVPTIKIPVNERIQGLSKHFYEEFGCQATFIARVPGRVNLIGEHIDYCGYPVLPMALEQDILIAGSVITEHKLYIRNTNCKYEDFDMDIKPYEEIIISADPNGKPYWYNYVLCGIKGAMEHLNNKVFSGLYMYIDGNIPPASGLSSSSALVSASCLAFLYSQNAILNKTEIASLCARCERYIGTQGGGMDQAIAFLAEKYCAQYITWNPTQATKVILPEDASFVVAHSLAEVNKAATNDYNRRVIECRLAAKLLSMPVSTDHKIITLGEVQKVLNKTLEEMADCVRESLPKDMYTKDEVSKMLRISENELNDLYLTPNTRDLTEFKLQQRALHVYEEAGRVEAFRKMCDPSESNGNVNGSLNGTNGINSKKKENNIINKLGLLMSESHKSLKNLYECSHENLDRLVDISMQNKVYSRLTGAGWGGCVVSLCSRDKVKEYIDALEEEFYVNHCKVDKNKAKSYVFATTPNYGAVIYLNS